MIGLALVLPSAAAAAPTSAGVSGTTLVLQAAPGTTNAVELQAGRLIRKGGDLTGVPYVFNVFDRGAGAGVDPATGCEAIQGNVTCRRDTAGASTEISRVRVLLGDRNDSFKFTALPVPDGGAPVATALSISGGPGSDSMTGGGGPDTIVGGNGANSARGSAGNDRLELRNGARDALIDCGTGTDTAVIDRIDPKPIACETIRRGP